MKLCIRKEMINMQGEAWLTEKLLSGQVRRGPESQPRYLPSARGHFLCITFGNVMRRLEPGR